MIEKILDDIHNKRIIDKNNLFEQLVTKRLNKSLESYYHDISLSANQAQFGTLRTFNKLLKWEVHDMSFISKVSSLSNIPESSLEKFKVYANTIHGDDVFVSKLTGENVHKVETLEGDIYITIENNIIKYKFIPNESFKNNIKKALINDKSPLLEKLGAKVIKVVSNIYEDLV